MKGILPYIIFVSFLFSNGILYCQNDYKEIDSVNAIPHDYIVSHTTTCIKLFKENLRKAESSGYRYGTGKAYGKLALADYIKGNYSASISEWIEAIKIFEELKKYEDLAHSYGELGYEIKRNDLNKAEYYMKMGIGIAEKNKLNKILAGLYDNYGVLKEMRNDPDSAMLCYKQALKIKYSISDSVGIPYSLNNISGIYAMKGNFPEAFKYLDLSDSFRKNEPGSYGLAENIGMRGSLYSMMGNTDSAIASYSKCLSISKRLKLSFYMQLCYQELTYLFEKKNNYKNALESFKNFAAVKDSLSGKETNERIAELQIAFETEKKDRIIANNKLEMKQRVLQLFIMGGVIALLIIILVWIYKYQKLKRERIKNELELRHKLDTAELENKLRSEKLRISKELHDNIGSQLTFMISSLDNMTYSLADQNVMKKVNNLRNFGRETLLELRDTVWAIKNEEGDTDRLILKVNEMVLRLNEDIESIRIVLNNSLSGTYKLSSIQMLNIFRIIQEAVQNAIKYSRTGDLLIEFTENADYLFVSVSDKGKGFDTTKEYSGHGIKNMKSRCEEAGGTFIITSNDTGTKITCKMNKCY